VKFPKINIGGKSESQAAKDISNKLHEKAYADPGGLLAGLNSGLSGLSEATAESRLAYYGPNTIAREKHKSPLIRLLDNVKNPLVLLLIALGVISFFTGDKRGAIVIFIMVVLGIVLRFYQEIKADNAAKKLRAMVRNTATVVRDFKESETPLQKLVPGDIIQLAAGDMVPADVRLLTAKDLFINQSALTGESISIEKHATLVSSNITNVFELSNICFLGSNVQSGSGMAVVISTGEETYLGAIASTIAEDRVLTNFDKGVDQLTWLMIRFIVIMVPTVFLINGLRHEWFEAFLFALAVAVGLTPEMLPMIVTVNLSKGALAMAGKKAIVKRLNSIQNFGAMNILCTDKTGTITQGKVVLEKHLDASGVPNTEVLHYGYLNSYYHTGLKNLLDDAILDHEDLEERLKAKEKYRKIDEIPFDFVRRRMSVVVEENTGSHILICKGAVEEIMATCTRVKVGNEEMPTVSDHTNKAKQIASDLNSEGFRVIAVAYKMLPSSANQQTYTIKDESDLVLLGFLAFLDPPKPSVAETLKKLADLKIDVKILTGDNEIITTYICKEVGIPAHNILLGPQIEAMNDDELATAASNTSIFAKLSPMDKERIIHVLESKGNVVGFLGDGINDAPALKAADVGISVDSAVDIAKESSDIILLETNLLILEQGVREGRKVFGNIVKYIKMAASSNFGNMFSVLGASLFLPFLPMLPLQVLTNNLLYDFSQIAIPTDEVDASWLSKPRKWAINEIQRFILFVGPISSIFDYVTFFIMLYVFKCWDNPALFQTGWFIESIFTQTLIIHIIRTIKIPFIESNASLLLIMTSLIIVFVGAWLPYSALAKPLGFVPLPALYWLFLVVILLSYIALTQVIKHWFIRKFGE
jgi:P-type Mg2+ transporter